MGDVEESAAGSGPPTPLVQGLIDYYAQLHHYTALQRLTDEQLQLGTQAALPDDDTNALLHFWRAFACMKLHQGEAAIRQLALIPPTQHAELALPCIALALASHAMCAKKDKRRIQELKSELKLVQKTSSNAALALASRYFLWSDKQPKAKQCCEKLLSKDKRNLQMLGLFGWIYYMSSGGDDRTKYRDKSHQLFRKVMKLTNPRFDIVALLGRIHWQEGDRQLDKALKECEMLEKLYSSDAREFTILTLEFRARLQLAMQQYSECKVTLKQLHNEDKKSMTRGWVDFALTTQTAQRLTTVHEQGMVLLRLLDDSESQCDDVRCDLSHFITTLSQRNLEVLRLALKCLQSSSSTQQASMQRSNNTQLLHRAQLSQLLVCAESLLLPVNEDETQPLRDFTEATSLLQQIIANADAVAAAAATDDAETPAAAAAVAASPEADRARVALIRLQCDSSQFTEAKQLLTALPQHLATLTQANHAAANSTLALDAQAQILLPELHYCHASIAQFEQQDAQVVAHIQSALAHTDAFLETHCSATSSDLNNLLYAPSSLRELLTWHDALGVFTYIDCITLYYQFLNTCIAHRDSNDSVQMLETISQQLMRLTRDVPHCRQYAELHVWLARYRYTQGDLVNCASAVVRALDCEPLNEDAQELQQILADEAQQAEQESKKSTAVATAAAVAPVASVVAAAKSSPAAPLAVITSSATSPAAIASPNNNNSNRLSAPGATSPQQQQQPKSPTSTSVNLDAIPQLSAFDNEVTHTMSGASSQRQNTGAAGATTAVAAAVGSKPPLDDDILQDINSELASQKQSTLRSQLKSPAAAAAAASAAAAIANAKPPSAQSSSTSLSSPALTKTMGASGKATSHAANDLLLQDADAFDDMDDAALLKQMAATRAKNESDLEQRAIEQRRKDAAKALETDVASKLRELDLARNETTSAANQKSVASAFQGAEESDDASQAVSPVGSNGAMRSPTSASEATGRSAESLALQQKKERIMHAGQQIEAAKSFCKASYWGEVFIKHGRRGAPHERNVTLEVVGSEIKIDWSSGFIKANKNDMKLLDGKSTEIFKNKSAKKASAALCFSIVVKERSLDLEAKTESIKQYWFEGMQLLLKYLK